MSIAISKQKGKYTYSDYLNWPDDEMWELIDGVPFDMSPAPSRQHQKISTELVRQFANYLLDKTCEIYDAPFDVRIPQGDEKDEDIDTVVQPDIVIVCDHNKLDDRGCKGAPDLIIEILSRNTSKKDLHDKFILYERSGVIEYWVVFPSDKGIDVYRLNEGHKYELSGKYQHPDKINVGIFSDLEIDLGLVFKK